MSKDDYGPMMGINSFFNSPHVPKEEIAGWYVRGHDEKGDYDEFVVLGNDNGAVMDAIYTRHAHWVDWHRVELRAGDPLLVGAK